MVGRGEVADSRSVSEMEPTGLTDAGFGRMHEKGHLAGQRGLEPCAGTRIQVKLTHTAMSSCYFQGDLLVISRQNNDVKLFTQIYLLCSNIIPREKSYKYWLDTEKLDGP